MIFHHLCPCLGPHSPSSCSLVLAVEDLRRSDFDQLAELVVVLAAAEVARVMMALGPRPHLASQMALGSDSGLEHSG